MESICAEASGWLGLVALGCAGSNQAMVLKAVWLEHQIASDGGDQVETRSSEIPHSRESFLLSLDLATFLHTCRSLLLG